MGGAYRQAVAADGGSAARLAALGPFGLLPTQSGTARDCPLAPLGSAGSGALPGCVCGGSPRHLQLRLPRPRRASSAQLFRAESSGQWSGLFPTLGPDDAHALQSPASAASLGSFLASDGSPNTARALRSGFSGLTPGSPAFAAAAARGGSGAFRGLLPAMSVEIIDHRSLVIGHCLGRGAEGAVFEARWQDAPVAVKEAPSVNEIEIYLTAGSHDNIVGLRGLSQKVGRVCGPASSRCLARQQRAASSTCSGMG
jgi:hypothetical protein